MNEEKLSNNIKSNSFENPQNVPVTSPIEKGKLVSRVNALISNNSIGTVINPQNINFNQDKASFLNYKSVIELLISLSTEENVAELCNKISSLIFQEADSRFYAIGLFKEKSNCINLRLQDKLGNNYSTKVFLKEEENPIVEVFNSRIMQFTEKEDYLKIPYYKDYSTIIIPLISVNKCIGVFIIEDTKANNNAKSYSLIANYLALAIHNVELLEKSDEFINTDALTLLYNHRGFQEIVTNEITRSDINKQSLSIIMMDINNITKINRELGHAKGDEVIKVVAEKVRQNCREGDIAGRYGGDEIAIVLPNTNSSQAKYVAEFLTYSLSCSFIDDIGPIKVSVGVATYPDCAKDKEQLLILAEQAMYISQAKGYKDGMSAIISSADFNFWDDVALKSYAEVVSKRHSQLGINFEEELLSKFHDDHSLSASRTWEVATSLAGAIDAKDPYTKGHSTSVSKFSEALARAINLPEKEIARITLGALLHDVGKIGIPETVLKKEGPLSDDEWTIMKQHPGIGADKVLQPNPNLRDLIPIVKYHHERIDGKGYPCGLKRDEIPLAAKIVAIADTYHALVSDRPYRKGMSIEKAFSILEEGAGTQWDEDLVRTFIQIAPSLGIDSSSF
ncbi:diguanylate cyclase [bacterium]|nr:diguanylate cyclase [bacterium]